MIPIWEKLIYKQAIKFILFAMTSLYAIYILIDFSLHSTTILEQIHTQPIKIFLYYLHHFIKRLDIFLPLVLMFAVIKILSSMNIHKELVALQMAGISLFRILRPFLCLAFFFSILSLANFEFFVPSSLKYIEQFKNEDSSSPSSLKIYLLEDNSKIICASYDDSKKLLLDAYWVIDSHNLWHMKTFTFSTSPFFGEYVDRYLVNENNELIKIASYNSYSFSQMPKKKKNIDPQNWQNHENLKLSSLVKKGYYDNYTSSFDKASIFTHLHYKISISFVSFLVVLALAPFCFHFSRNLSIFFIFMVSLFSLIFYYTLMDGATILSENRAISPFLALWTLFFIILALSLVKIFRIPIFYSQKN